MLKKIKSQVSFTDFIISVLVLGVVITLYFHYTIDFLGEKAVKIDDLLIDTKTISSSLSSPGNPKNWDIASVENIGFTEGGSRLNGGKVKKFGNMDYEKSKKLLGTKYEYFLFFEDSNGNLINLNGKCGYGSPEVKIVNDFKKTGYLRGGDDKFIQSEIHEIETELGITIIDTNNKNTFRNTINNYDLWVIEEGKLASSDKDLLENFVKNGGIFILSEEPFNFDINIFDRFFDETNDQNVIATSVIKDSIFDFEIGNTVHFDATHHFEEGLGSIETISVFPNGWVAISKFKYGQGLVYHFADFDAGYNGFEKSHKDDFGQIVKEGIKKEILGCKSFDLSNIKAKNLVKIERILNYESEVVKMVLYLWNKG